MELRIDEDMAAVGTKDAIGVLGNTQLGLAVGLIAGHRCLFFVIVYIHIVGLVAIYALYDLVRPTSINQMTLALPTKRLINMLVSALCSYLQTATRVFDYNRSQVGLVYQLLFFLLLSFVLGVKLVLGHVAAAGGAFGPLIY